MSTSKLHSLQLAGVQGPSASGRSSGESLRDFGSRRLRLGCDISWNGFDGFDDVRGRRFCTALPIEIPPSI